MTSSKGAVECCMCGDYGLPHELFRCRSCHFRSQHRYCSDLYPKAESYQLCNWCLKEDGGKAMKEAIESQEDGGKAMKEAIESRSLSSSCSISNSNKNISTSSSGSNEVGLKLQRCSFPLHLNSPIKKQRSPERSTQKKNNISDESLRRTRSEDISNVTRQKQVSRGKVRRYKLLEEVSS